MLIVVIKHGKLTNDPIIGNYGTLTFHGPFNNKKEAEEYIVSNGFFNKKGVWTRIKSDLKEEAYIRSIFRPIKPEEVIVLESF